MKLRYEYRVFALEIALATVLTVIIFLVSPGRGITDYVNLPGLATSLVALNSGITIAIFLALFHSNDKNIEKFREFKTAAKQAYKIFLINAVFICLSTLLVLDNISSDLSVNLALTGLCLALIGTLVNIWHIFDLMKIMFQK